MALASLAREIMRKFGVTQAYGGLALVCLFLQAGALRAADQDCKKLYQDHQRTDLSLSYEQFDQDMDGGWRALDSLGCEKEALELVKEYVRVTGSTRSSLRWHIAQMSGTVGDTETAIKYAKLSLSPSEDFSRDALRWNDYVLGTIAFLERDLDALKAHRAKVADARDAHFGNTLNLKYLDAMIAHFDRDYRYVSQHISK
jgi:hypothetical protein